MEDTLGLTGKALLAHQASAKIEEGRRLVAEGKLELLNLFPDSDKKAVAHKMLRNLEGNFKMNTKTDPELIEIVLDMLKNGKQPVTANLIQKKLGITRSHTERLREKLRSQVKTEKQPGARGGGRIWELIKPKSKVNKKPDEKSLNPERVKQVLDHLKTSNWCTLHSIMKAVGIDWYQLNQIIRHLADQGTIKSVKKTKNPAHQNTSSYNREFTYWIIV